MRLALEEAEKARDLGEVPVGAVLVKDNQVVAAAHNRKETLSDPTAHAEIQVLREAAGKLGDWRLRGCELYVTLEPCPMCMGAICQTELSALNFGAPEPVYGAVESLFMRSQFESILPGNFQVYGGIMEEEVTLLMENFFKSLRKR